MDMTGEERIAASRETVWAALNDPEVLKQCIPGCQSLERQSDTDMTARVKLQIGPVSATFSGKVKLSELDPPNGYRIAGEPGHVAALKGVIADEVRFESGFIKATMTQQARWEHVHVRRASRVIATSRYSAERAAEFYGLPQLPRIVPELIDLAEWRNLLAQNPAAAERFTVLFVGRLYRRKRVEVLLRAADIGVEAAHQLTGAAVGEKAQTHALEMGI